MIAHEQVIESPPTAEFVMMDPSEIHYNGSCFCHASNALQSQFSPLVGATHATISASCLSLKLSDKSTSGRLTLQRYYPCTAAACNEGSGLALHLPA